MISGLLCANQDKVRNPLEIVQCPTVILHTAIDKPVRMQLDTHTYVLYNIMVTGICFVFLQYIELDFV